MDRLCRLMEKVSLNTFDPGRKCYEVHVTHINSPSSFYIRPIAYDKYLKKASKPAGTVQPPDLELPTPVIFESKILNKFTRGVVVTAHKLNRSTKYDMFAIDEGFTEELVRITNIHKCGCPEIPPLASHCRLADCKPIGTSDWTEREIDAMKYFVGDRICCMVVRENDTQTLTVVLSNNFAPEDIAKTMALTNYSHMGYASNKIGRFTDPDPAKLFFKYKSFKVGDILKVRTQSGKELDNFYVADKLDYKQYLEEKSNFVYFTRQEKDLPSEELQEDEPVGVRVYNEYERGIVKKVLSPTLAQVQLVDWGKIEECNIGSLKRMSSKFFYNPAIAIYCSLAKSEDEQLMRKYLYPGYEYKIEILETGEGLTKPNIVKIIAMN